MDNDDMLNEYPSSGPEEEEDLDDAYFLEKEITLKNGKEQENKITPPVMSIYEKSKVVSDRLTQLDNGYKTTMEKEVSDKKLTKSYDIAMLEFENNKLPPFVIKRVMPNGDYELWSREDFEYLP